ncbi:helix-turn-helix domain-containing protein [Myxosarcina sp. GI1(2024)]
MVSILSKYADTNQSGGDWSDRDISQALKISVATIERVRQRLVEEGKLLVEKKISNHILHKPIKLTPIIYLD